MSHTICSCCSDASIINQAVNRITAAHEMQACLKVELVLNSLIALVCMEEAAKETSEDLVYKFLSIHGNSFHEALLKARAQS